MITLIYDGACPFCNHYIRKQRVEARYGPLVLLDARSADPRLLPYWQQGYPLDEGMLIDHDGRISFGAGALTELARLSAHSGPLSPDNLFINATASRLLYPAFKILRRMALFLRKTGPLRHPPITDAAKHKAG